MNQELTKKCELCNMTSTHTEVSKKGVTHYFCGHHSLQNLEHKKTKTERLLPLLGIFLFIILFPFVRQFGITFSSMLYMMDFMGVFFLVFGFFKLLDLEGFVAGFSQYDLITAKLPAYGYVYPFVEIALGILYLMGYMFMWQNLLALFLAGIGMYTAFKYINHEDEIPCVCLGTSLDLPMTWVTVSENAVMFLMVLFMMLM